MDKLKVDHDIVTRTAGSHSPIDVIAINRKTKRIELIQSKPKNLSENKKKLLEEEYGWLNNEFLVKFSVR